MFDINTASITTLDASKPAKLVWSPDGDRLATAWQLAESTRLELRNISGDLLSSTTLAGIPDRLLWSTESGLLVITSQLKIYSFGGDLTLLLHRWDGQTPPETTTLHNATIKPLTAKNLQQGRLPGTWGRRLQGRQRARDPLGDRLSGHLELQSRDLLIGLDIPLGRLDADLIGQHRHLAVANESLRG